MTAPRKKGLKRNPFWRIVDIVIAIAVGVYIVPAAKHSLFPDQMTRLEKMLRRSTMDGCKLAVDRQHELKIVLTVYNGARSITTEIYSDVIHELEPSGDTRTFFTYSVNRDSNEVFYLTRTRIEADADLKRVRRLEVGVCGRLVDQHAGVTRHEGYKPVYACEVPEREAVCLAADSATESK
jgi:hypothetical protein